jgi:CheY-like chemotaxis protein
MSRILLIGDDDAVRTVLTKMLVASGHTVVEARNGKEGLALAPETKADLLITDLVMPEMEGFEVLMALRQKHRKLKIIAISGGGRFSADDYLKTAEALGADRILAKPFSHEVLITTVNELLAEAGGSAPAAPAD